MVTIVQFSKTAFRGDKMLLVLFGHPDRAFQHIIPLKLLVLMKNVCSSFVRANYHRSMFRSTRENTMYKCKCAAFVVLCV